MSKYRILYYTWHEYTFKDCVESMCNLGCTVDILSDCIQNYDKDEIFMAKLKNYITLHNYDCIFTFNYFPVISRTASSFKIRYISWVFDSPHLTLNSVTLTNDCNAIFLFDYSLYQKYRDKGVTTVYYMPLAYNHLRVEKTIDTLTHHYSHDITFLGTLYDDQYDFFEQIKYLPPKLNGFIHAIIDAQQLIYGLDICDLLFDHEKCNEMSSYVHIDMGDQFIDYRDELFRNMIRKKTTVIERRQILSMIGQQYSIDLYSPKAPEHLPVNYNGYAEYIHQMPEIFYTSKINLNITLRSILSGIPLRVIDILGSHGFLLTNYQSELAEYFINGEDLVWYESKEDLMDKLCFYLAHDSERECIAAHGNQKVQKFFTYSELLQRIFHIAL